MSDHPEQRAARRGPWTMRGSLAAAVVCAAGAVAIAIAYDMSVRPVMSVRVTGPFVHVSRADLEAAVADEVHEGFFAVDVEAIGEAARGIAWVRSVQVSRVWPDSLDIVVEERDAVARWSDDALLEADGNVFRPARVEGVPELPLLDGPENSAAEVLAAWEELNVLTAALPKGRVRSLRLTGRGDWYAQLDNGVEIVLDRTPRDGWVQQVLPSLGYILGERIAQVERVDMRYGHGFAVRWKPQAQGEGEAVSATRANGVAKGGEGAS